MYQETSIIQSKLIIKQFMMTFYFFKPLTKIGIKKIQDCKYSIKTNYKDYIKFKSAEKNYNVIREIKLQDNFVKINDKINTKKNLI